MKRWLLKIAIFVSFLFLFHLETLFPTIFGGVRALSPFLFLASFASGSFVSLGLLVIWAGFLLLVLNVWKRRFFCRWFCPLGFLQDVLRSSRSALLRFVPFLRFPSFSSLRFFRYLGMILALATFGALIFGGFTFLWMDPLVLCGGIHHANWLRWFLLGIGISVPFFPRLWCFFLCPCGGVQELLWNAAHCTERKKKTILSKSESESSSPQSFPTVSKVPVASNVSSVSDVSGVPAVCDVSDISDRRRFLGVAGVLAFSAVGVVFLKQAMKRSMKRLAGQIRDVFRFRPPGAVAEEEFLARCSRCGACVGTCPTKLLKTIDDFSQPELLGTPVADFSPKTPEDRIFCDESCVRCAQVCPTGALKKFQPAEKKSVRLAKCEFDYSLCRRYYQMECSICLQTCPFEALDEVWSDEAYAKIPRVNAELCTGCGKCVAFCPGEPLIRWEADSDFAFDAENTGNVESAENMENVESTGKKPLTLSPLSGISDAPLRN